MNAKEIFFEKGKQSIQSNLLKMTTLGTSLKWSSWTDGHLIKYL